MTTTSPPPMPGATTAPRSLRPALDPRKLTELAALRPAVRARVIAAYRRDAPDVMSSIRRALATRDPVKARQGAHRLKSSSAALGALKLAALYGELETMALLGALEEAASLVVELDSELAQVLDGLATFSDG